MSKLNTKTAEFMQCYDLCKKYRGPLQGLMTHKTNKLFYSIYDDVTKLLLTDEGKKLITDLALSFKMTERSILEVYFQGKFVEKSLAQQQNKGETYERLQSNSSTGQSGE